MEEEQKKLIEEYRETCNVYLDELQHKDLNKEDIASLIKQLNDFSKEFEVKLLEGTK